MKPRTRRALVAGAVSATIVASAGSAAQAGAQAPAKKSKSTAYSAAQVATHDSAGNCWTSINGKVYNLTKYIAKHPGGSSRIIALCGTDGTAAFSGQHGTSGSPVRKLSRYRIGVLSGAPATSPTTKPTKPAKHHDDDDDRGEDRRGADRDSHDEDDDD